MPHNKTKMTKSGFFVYPEAEPDHSQKLMGSKLDRNGFSDSFHEVVTSSICIILHNQPFHSTHSESC